MLTISSATWTAKLGRLMESPRIERVPLFNVSVQTSICCKSHTNISTKSLKKRFSKQSPYAYSTVEFRRSSTQYGTRFRHRLSIFIYGNAEMGMKNERNDGVS